MRDRRDTATRAPPTEQSPASHPFLHPFLRPALLGVKRWRYWAVIALWLGAAVFFWQWWLNPANVLNPFSFAAVTLPLVWVYSMQLYFVVVFLRARVSNAPAPEPGQYRVAMIVTKTPSEPFELLQRTLKAMLAQDYPHDTWLADESPSPDSLVWCAAHGVRVVSRKGVMDYHRPVWPRRTRCKEGNLAYFYDLFGYDDYDIVSQLDADHVPQPGYLREILRPFADPGVGYVSAPSICNANAAESWAARTRLHVEAAFHGVMQAGYTGALAPMCIGSHYAVRTAALKEIGGLGPELAEDHSTSMLMNAGGWRGVHAIDAIAFGDGPATLTDLVTQEFQWSRSLLTLLLSHTSHYVGHLSARLQFLFVFCQLWYPLFALTTALMYFMPIGAVVFDMRFADVTYPAFVGHSLPSVVVLTFFAFMLKWDRMMRPVDASIIGWEKALFMALQWPWVLWGCIMALRDRLTGRFVDFRITPKGTNVARRLPGRVLGVYVALALGCLLPVLLVDGVQEARGFYLLLTFNAIIYTAIVGVIVVHHRIESGTGWRDQARDTVTQFGFATALVVLAVVALGMRATESVHALAFGLEPLRITRAEYAVSGAGSSAAGPAIRFRFDLGWN
ncbi:MAG: glycosyltransferase [Phaeovulum sp.]|uniref:glycosyltransferase family 2 protein n=1 Tax=Phaeovulum sp. TaxID=2934796 RepID=UPI00272F72E1|nr:glycosyltransferase family 2 protein [Phaeovulum sp.]MDP2063788.1 glycosyltransferase [Phaeovulum sp.]